MLVSDTIQSLYFLNIPNVISNTSSVHELNVQCNFFSFTVTAPTPVKVERVGVTNTWTIVIDQTVMFIHWTVNTKKIY